MRARETTRPAPTSPSYLTVEEGGPHAPHVLRVPTFAGAALADRLTVTAHNEAVAVYSREQVGYDAMTSSAMGAVIGLCWAHPDIEIESKAPSLAADLGDWTDYGEAVVSEMQDQGYTLLDCKVLFYSVMPATLDLLKVQAEAGERADFSEGPSAAASPEPESAAAEATP